MSGRAPSLWRVSIEAHPLPARFFIPAQRLDVVAFTAEGARREAVREAHRAAGVRPSWRCLVHSLSFAVAVCVGREAPR
jgi:hypothetical protein